MCRDFGKFSIFMNNIQWNLWSGSPRRHNKSVPHRCPHQWDIYMLNKAIRDGRPRPPRHQVGWDIPLHFDTNPESLRPFVPEIWPNNVFNLSATYDLDLWPKILFHNDRLRNGWDITLWNFAKTRTNKHTHKQTHTQTNRHGHYNTSPSPYGGRGNYKMCPHKSVPWREVSPDQRVPEERCYCACILQFNAFTLTCIGIQWLMRDYDHWWY